MVWPDDGRSRLNFKPIDGSGPKTYVAVRRLTRMHFPLLPLLPLARPLVLALVAACAGCDAASAVSTVVLATKGGVSIGGRTETRVLPGEFLAPPVMIRTGADGAVVLSPVPGIMLRLAGDSEFVLDEVALRKRGEDITARLVRGRLAKGRAQIWVDEFKRGSVDFHVRTAAGDLVFARPVVADLAVETDGSARLICADGGLVAAGVRLAAGQWIPLSQGTVRPAPREVADDDGMWAQLLDLRRLEPALLELQDRQRERTPGQFSGLRPKVPKK